MLALMDSIERGDCVKNEFPITPELVSLFRGFWQKLVRSGHSPNFALPFFHLKNERSQVWQLHTLKGFEKVLTSSGSVKSLSALNEYVLYGQLADEFYRFLLVKGNRDLTKALIREKYFPEASQESLNNSYDYLGEIEDQIVNDDPVEYRKRIQKLSDVPKEALEEEVFLRESAFKRKIPLLYNNTCAISGLKVDTTLNASMIDACHVVPWAESHDDTVTNGISLCPNLHRAFDRGLVAIDHDYKVILSDQFVESQSPFNLSQFISRRLILPDENRYKPSQENLEWHRKRWGFD